MSEDVARFMMARPQLPPPPAVPNYVLRPGRWAFLQRLAFWVLEKLGCKTKSSDPHPMLPYFRADSVVLEKNAVLALLMKHVTDLTRFMAARPRVVFMGAPQYDEILQTPLARPLVVNLGQRGGLHLPNNMQVVFVPWLDGVVVLDERTVQDILCPGAPSFGIPHGR